MTDFTFKPAKRENAHVLIGLAYLKSRLHYEPETGQFTWLERPVFSSRHKTWNTKFCGRIAGSLRKDGYIQICIDGEIYLSHRLAWFYMTGEWPLIEADHKNRTRGDNRWDNLREATEDQNSANAGLTRRNTSGVRGLSWDKKNHKWDARIMARGKIIFLGRFAAEQFNEAVKLVAQARADYHGDFANN